MLFNSIPFLFLFLPVTLVSYFIVGRRNGNFARVLLAAASLAFYAYWDIRFLPLLIGSICVNFLVGREISRAISHAGENGHARWLLISGVTFNVGLLAFFKYANLLIQTTESVASVHFDLPHIILPIGISFFTFTQIAFLADVYFGKADEYEFWDYALFVSYFPHQIAGPILHHREMMTQFKSQRTASFVPTSFIVGLSILALGLAKKVFLADAFADITNPVFDAAEAQVSIRMFEAWFGVLAYALQLYFDFSAYCDMAIGISFMFGIRLPINFNSPYKATNIIDFWRRWHMTLSRFLLDYLYIPLGGSRKGPARRYTNLLITMALGGLWHGGSWTFLVWGLLHGVYLVANHAWRHAVGNLSIQFGGVSWLWTTVSWMITFAAVLIAWVFFRAHTFNGAQHLLIAMFSGDGVGTASVTGSAALLGGLRKSDALLCLVFLGVCLCAPNLQQVFSAYRPALNTEDRVDRDSGGAGWIGTLRWRANWKWAAVVGVLMALAISRLGNDSEFLYFNF